MNTPAIPAALPSGIDDNGVFRSLFGAYPDALLVADANGQIVLANPAATELLGYAVDELVGAGIDMLVPDSIRPRHAPARWARRWSLSRGVEMAAR